MSPYDWPIMWNTSVRSTTKMTYFIGYTTSSSSAASATIADFTVVAETKTMNVYSAMGMPVVYINSITDCEAGFKYSMLYSAGNSITAYLSTLFTLSFF